MDDLSISRQSTFLRNWRKFKKLSQEAAAESLEIKQGTLSKIERGQLPYNQDFLEKAALVYGCDASDLLAVDPLAPRETDVVKLFRRATPEVKRIVETILRTGTGG